MVCFLLCFVLGLDFWVVTEFIVFCVCLVCDGCFGCAGGFGF